MLLLLAVRSSLHELGRRGSPSHRHQSSSPHHRRRSLRRLPSRQPGVGVGFNFFWGSTRAPPTVAARRRRCHRLLSLSLSLSLSVGGSGKAAATGVGGFGYGEMRQRRGRGTRARGVSEAGNEAPLPFLLFFYFFLYSLYKYIIFTKISQHKWQYLIHI